MGCDERYVRTVKLRSVGRAGGAYGLPVPLKILKRLQLTRDEFAIKIDKEKRRIIYEPVNRKIELE